MNFDNRDQMNLMPMCMDDMIAPDSEVRAIDAIDKRNIPSIGFTYSVTKETGRKPYNPNYNKSGRKKQA